MYRPHATSGTQKSDWKSERTYSWCIYNIAARVLAQGIRPGAGWGKKAYYPTTPAVIGTSYTVVMGRIHMACQNYRSWDETSALIGSKPPGLPLIANSKDSKAMLGTRLIKHMPVSFLVGNSRHNVCLLHFIFQWHFSITCQ